MNIHVEAAPAVVEVGAVLDIPLNKLKKSPKNARKTPHTEAAIAALAASIRAKSMLQAPVVEPELDEAGQPSGFYLVTIGEGRRLAQCLRAKRKEIKKTEPIRCVVDLAHDPQEISLDENVTRSDMHPADQFEAFRDLAARKAWGPEEIGARFGVSAHVVRQRLRLGAVSPKLLAIYREDGLTLDQLMAFGITEDHARQEQVYENLSWNKSPAQIRRAMTETNVPASDRRAVFVGVEAYTDAGGAVLRDLFTEDGGGWLEDVALLDRLTVEKLNTTAVELRDTEGWKWAQAHLDWPAVHHNLSRVYPHRVERAADVEQRIANLHAEFEDLEAKWSEMEDLPGEVESRLKHIEVELASFGVDYAFDPDELARGGVFVMLNQDGTVRVERGLVRPEDVTQPAPVEPECGSELERPSKDETGMPASPQDDEDGDDCGPAPLPDRLVADLTAHRTASLRDAVAGNPEVALLSLLHALALRTFYPGAVASCLDVRPASRPLGHDAVGIEDGAPCRRIADRHETWARQMPKAASEVWTFVVDLDSDSRMALLAHCVSLTVDAVHSWERKAMAWAHADALAERLALDVSKDWRPTRASYLDRVPKARILEAVREGVSPEAADRLTGLKKPEMAQAAEAALAGSRWLPPLLRTASPDLEAAQMMAAE
jgi:ParB family chromosome partitioning protein